MQADFDDIRFTDDDQTTLIDHWREEYTASTSATFWVEVPSIDAASNKTIYMYYGNSNEITQSNGSNTFLFFDNFNNSIDWQYSIDGDEDVWFHSGAVYDGSYFSGNDHAPYRMQQWDVDDGTLLQSQDIAGAVGSPPLFIGDYMYFHAGLRSDENTDSKLYKMSISNFSVYSAVDIQANSSVEVIAADNTYLYISEADKVSKRLLSDLSEVDSFAAQYPRGILRKGTKIYFKTLDNYFMVVDTVDMTEDWKIQLDVTTADTSYSVPIYDQNNNRFYAVDSNNNRTDGNVYSINPDTHSVDWTVNYVGYALTMTPAFKDDVLYVSIYNASGKGYHKALDITDGGNEIWSKQYDDDSGWGSWVLDDNYMYTIEKPYNTSEGDPSYFLAVDQSDGSVVAKEETDYTKLCNTPIITKGKVIVGTAGAVYAFNIGSGSDENVLYYHGDENYTNYYQDAIDEYFEFNLHNKWTHGFRGGTEIRDGYLESLSEVGWNSVKPLYNYPEDFVVEYKFNNDTESTHMHYFRYEGGSDYVEAQYRLSEDKMRIDDKYGGASHITDKAGVVMDSGVWNEAKYVLAGQNIKEYFNGANEHSVDLSGENASVSAELGLCYSATGRVDDYRVRKYAATEPTASLGAETGLYDNGSPTIYSKSTVSQNFTSLSAFSETAIKNGGEIKYQLSNNGGTTWYWYSGGWQVAADNYAQANTADQVNTNVANFPVGEGELCFKAYLNSSGSQLVRLDAVNVTYTNVPVTPTPVPTSTSTSTPVPTPTPTPASTANPEDGGGGDDSSQDYITTDAEGEISGTHRAPEFSLEAKSFSIEYLPLSVEGDGSSPLVLREDQRIKIYTQRPLFQGKTIPNAKLIINIYSDQKITNTIYSDGEGFWKYQVSEDLAFGNHKIQTAIYNPDGSLYYSSPEYDFEILEPTLELQKETEAQPDSQTNKTRIYIILTLIVGIVGLGIYWYYRKRK